MKINSKFNIHDRVIIKELSLEGRVVAITINEYGIEYKVNYFADSIQQNAWLIERDIDLIKGN